MRCLFDLLSVVAIIVPNVLSFLTDGIDCNDDICSACDDKSDVDDDSYASNDSDVSDGGNDSV